MTRDVAERKLATAERDFARCSPLRRRHREQLRAKIELQRHAIELAHEKLESTAMLIEQTRLNARRIERTRERPERERTLARHRQPPGLTLER